MIAADVPQELIDLRSRPDLDELGAGPAFGSCKRTVVELNATHLDEILFELQRDVLAFDWWIRNADRTLSERGGNPNLFWDADAQGLVVIDHNQAFDSHFDAQEFLSNHAFSAARVELFSDWIVQAQYKDRFAQALQNWPSIC